MGRWCGVSAVRDGDGNLYRLGIEGTAIGTACAGSERYEALKIVKWVFEGRTAHDASARTCYNVGPCTFVLVLGPLRTETEGPNFAIFSVPGSNDTAHHPHLKLRSFLTPLIRLGL